MFLDNLLEARVVQLGESCKIVDIGNYVAQVLLQQHEILFQGYIGLAAVRLIGSLLICLRNDIVYFLLARANSFHNLLALDLLESEDLVQFSFQLLDKLLLVLFVPWPSFGLRVISCRFRLVLGVQSVLQAIVVDIVVVPVLDEGSFELVTESAIACK